MIFYKFACPFSSSQSWKCPSPIFLPYSFFWILYLFLSRFSLFGWLRSIRTCFTEDSAEYMHDVFSPGRAHTVSVDDQVLLWELVFYRVRTSFPDQQAVRLETMSSVNPFFWDQCVINGSLQQPHIMPLLKLLSHFQSVCAQLTLCMLLRGVHAILDKLSPSAVLFQFCAWVPPWASVSSQTPRRSLIYPVSWEDAGGVVLEGGSTRQSYADETTCHTGVYSNYTWLTVK